MADCTWTGKAYSTDWNDKKNWKPEQVPGKDDGVVVSKAETSWNYVSVPAGTKVKQLTLSFPAGVPGYGGLEGAPLSVTEQFTWLGGGLDAGLDAQTEIAQVLISGSPSKTNPPSLGGVEGAALKVKNARLENATRELGYGVRIIHTGRFESYGESLLKDSGGGVDPFLITPSSGVLFVVSGTLTVDGVILRATGTVELAPGAVLSLEGSVGTGLHFLDKGARVLGSGKIRVCNGGRLLAVESALVAAGATLELADGGMIEDPPPGELPYPILGPIQERQLLRVDGTLLWTGGEIEGNVVVNPRGMLKTEGAGVKWVDYGLLRILGSAHLSDPGPLKVNGGELQNEGEVVLHDGMSVVLSGNSQAFTQTAGVLRISPKAVLRCDAPLRLKGGRLEGSGRIVGDVVQNGTTGPGDLESTGILTIDGSYKHTASGRLDVRIRGPQPGGGYDQLAVTGPVMLSGELRFTVAGYQPILGTRFAVVTGDGVDGKFRQITGLEPVARDRSLRTLYGEKDLTLWVDLAAIGSRPRLSEAYERLIANGWSLGRRNILIGNSDVDLENKILYIDDDEENDATMLLWVHAAVLQAYREQDDFRRKAILDKGLEIFSVENNLTDLESMASLYDWAAWFWYDPTGNDSRVHPFMDDMVLAFTGLIPSLRTENDDPIYNILRQEGTRDEDTGFKGQFRDGGAQVRHATMSIQASLLYGPLGWSFLQGRELVGKTHFQADFRLNNQCADIGLRLDSLFRLLNIGEILRTELGDPSQTGHYDGPQGGYPDK